MSIAEQLLIARRRAGMTQRSLSEKSGVKLSLVGDIERERHLPNSRTLITLAAALGTTFTIGEAK